MTSFSDLLRKSFFSWTAAVSLIAGILLLGLLPYCVDRSLEIRARTQKWRIGYHQTEPFISRGPDGNPVGFGKDVLTEAARRARIELEWIFVPQGASAAFRTGAIDLFPRSSDVTGLSRAPYISDSWFESFYGLAEKAQIGASRPENFVGKRVATGPTPFARVFASRNLPGAIILPQPNWKAVLISVCRGDADAAFAELREAMSALSSKPPECLDQSIHLRPLRHAVLEAGIGSSTRARRVADMLRAEIGHMAAEGQLSDLHARWYLATPNEVTSVYQISGLKNRERVLLIVSGVLVLLLLLVAAAAWKMRQLRLSAWRAIEALRGSEMRHRLLFEGSRDAMMTIAPPSWKFTSGNPAALKMFEAEDTAQFTGLGLREVLPERQPDACLSVEKAKEAIEATLREGSYFFEWTQRRLDGAEFPASVLFTRIEMAGETLIQANVRDITERRKAEEALARQAAHDSLTGLANRTLFTGRLTRCIEQNRRDPGYIFGVLFLDLDRFKVINDSLGHVAGDHLLIEIGRRLAQTIRTSDLAGRLTEPRTVARLGGDEFAVLMENVHSVENAQRIADRVQGDMNAPFVLEGRSVFITFSIGVALSNNSYQSAEEILRDADIAMYAAKSAGKARFAVFDPSMRARAIARLEIETDLRRALASHELFLHYQPEVDLRSGEIVGFEALVRWQHPKYGIVPPLDFIPIAEETGLIAPLGAWVLEEACGQMRRWHSAFPDLPHLRMSVNISGKQLADKDLFRVVAHALQVSGLSPECLDLEITESVLMDDTETAIQTLLNLKGLGIGLQIDDFGTGYSSLSYLHRLPFDTLKIDRSFVNLMDEQEDGIEIVRTIMALAQSLRLKVIAEGVENRKQLSYLREMGCGFAQGNHFFQPLDGDAAEKLLAERSLTGTNLSELALAG